MLLELDDPGNAQILDYWLRLRGAREMPRVDDYDALAITKLLPRVTMLDVLAEDHLRVRFFGPEDVLLFGRDITGLNILDLYSPGKRRLVRDYFHKVWSWPAIAKSLDRIRTRGGYEILREAVFLPLTDEMGRVRRILSRGARLAGADVADDDFGGSLASSTFTKQAYLRVAEIPAGAGEAAA